MKIMFGAPLPLARQYPREVLRRIAGLDPYHPALNYYDWDSCYPVVEDGRVEGIIDGDGQYTDRTGYTERNRDFEIIDDAYAVLVEETPKLYYSDAAPYYNHGCRDSAVWRDNGDGTATCIEATSCHSCWQVGHDRDHVYVVVGEVCPIDALPDLGLEPEDEEE